MTGNDTINLTLDISDWREVWRILNNDSGWHTHLREIEESCRNERLTMQFTVARTWPMSATVRETNPELADRISVQMNAQLV